MGDLRTQALADRRVALDRLLARRAAAAEAAERERAALLSAEGEASAVRAAREAAQRIAQALQQSAHEQIARVVSSCLSAVFDDPYEFRIRFDCKRGRTEARLAFVRDGLELDDPLGEVGGGVVDVAALALRLACLLLARPPRRRLLALDEPFGNVRGAGNRARTRRMLERLAAEMGVQFVLSTDIPEYRLGKVVEMG